MGDRWGLLKLKEPCVDIARSIVATVATLAWFSLLKLVGPGELSIIL